MANQILAHADGFVVGSYFVNAIAQNKTPDQVQELAVQLLPNV